MVLGVAPRAGFEPATNRLTAGCSTTELPGNGSNRGGPAYNKGGSACLEANRGDVGQFQVRLRPAPLTNRSRLDRCRVAGPGVVARSLINGTRQPRGLPRGKTGFRCRARSHVGARVARHVRRRTWR